MPINDTYVVPEHVVNFLCNHERSFLALRLIYGLLYALDTALRGKMALVPAHFPREHRVRTSSLAAAVGPEKAKDNRWIHDACEELADQNILKTATVQGRVFRFQLGNEFSAAFRKPTKAFAIMRTEQVRQCRTLHDLIFLSLACLHGGKNRPRFLLPRIPVRLEPTTSRISVLPQDPPKQAPWRVTWCRSSRSWTNSALRVSAILGHGYLIGPRQDMIDDFVSEVAVKAAHAKTLWERGKLYKFPPGTRCVIEITAGSGCKTTLNAEALENKWHQTVIQ
ncbi:hypothetical protein [Sediminimonas qiaohouensis]|uniref:hypothetical protein n=1 Tax=Sediminimonas qiaohouensis TaxID=552061 RepID=UPI00047E4FC2|nr:hypothetical protein [Sediminimonas qiaohouensis]